MTIFPPKVLLSTTFHLNMCDNGDDDDDNACVF